MKTKRKVRKVNRGLAPAPDEAKRMRGLGYAQISTLVQEFRVPVSTLRSWMANEGWARDTLPEVAATRDGAKPRAFKQDGRVWILAAAVAAKKALPAGVA